VSSGSPWVTIPGLSKTFTLAGPALVHLRGEGTIRIASGTLCGASIRFVVDGSELGHPTWGHRYTLSGDASTHHNSWSLQRAMPLGPGAHTVALQARTDGTLGCLVCAEIGPVLAEYTSCTLAIMAFYQ
jgi:hypothetical protein